MKTLLAAIAVIAMIVAAAVAQHFVQTTGKTELVEQHEGLPPPHAQFPEQPPDDLQRSMEFTTLQVGTEGGIVTLDGQIHVYETTPGVSYVWSVRVYKGQEVVKEHHYSDQPAWLAAGKGVMQPQFHDQFPMPPGSYRVELSLYAVPEGFNFGTVKPGENIKAKVLAKVSRSSRITIG